MFGLMAESLKTQLLVKTWWNGDCPFILVYFLWRIQTGQDNQGQGELPRCGKELRLEHSKGVKRRTDRAPQRPFACMDKQP